MEKQMSKMPKIGQYKDVIREVKHKATFKGLDENGQPIYDPYATLPTLNYEGTVKSHGTNAGIVFTWNTLKHDYDVHTQSKNNIITPENDNMGFATFAYTAMGGTFFNELLAQIMRNYSNIDYTPQTITVFGEWCGGNIQAKVALTQLPKMFLVFAIKIDNVWMKSLDLKNIRFPQANIYNIHDFKTFTMNIDFNNPEQFTNNLGEITLEVEKLCPIGQYFGVEGVGEGVVWKCITEGYTESRFWMKVKGDEHAKGGKVKTLAPVDTERFENIQKLVDGLVTPRRLEQGFEYFTEMQIPVERKNISTYIKWVIGDVVAEELQTIADNGFAVKDVAGVISKKARDAFFAKENEMMGL